MPLTGTAKAPESWAPVVYGVYDLYDLYDGINFASRARRDERWKYVWNPQDIDELYDLDSDPHEMTNLASRGEFAAVKSQLQQRLLAWLREIGDPFPERTGALPPAGTVMATGRPGP